MPLILWPDGNNIKKTEAINLSKVWYMSEAKDQMYSSLIHSVDVLVKYDVALEPDYGVRLLETKCIKDIVNDMISSCICSQGRTRLILRIFGSPDYIWRMNSYFPFWSRGASPLQDGIILGTLTWRAIVSTARKARSQSWWLKFWLPHHDSYKEHHILYSIVPRHYWVCNNWS